jgi:hypothetical protein
MKCKEVANLDIKRKKVANLEMNYKKMATAETEEEGTGHGWN